MNIVPYLEKHTEALIKELSVFIVKPLPEEVRCVEVLIFRESLPGVPFRIYFSDKFKGPAKTIESFQPLKSINLLIDSPDYICHEDAICDCLDLEDEDEQDSCMDEVYARVNRDNKIVASWFSECWLKAGGREISLPCIYYGRRWYVNPINLRSGEHIRHLQDYKKIFDG